MDIVSSVPQQMEVVSVMPQMEVVPVQQHLTAGRYLDSSCSAVYLKMK